MANRSLLRLTERGLYCPAGDFYVDPWQPVARAVVTHAHGDHLAPGCGEYWMASSGAAIFRLRVGEEANLHPVNYGETQQFGQVRVSFHPAGHILGSAQVRVEYQGDVWVVSGDYKRTPDPTCQPFEVVPCDVFITEATFGLPIYRWPEQQLVFEQINQWWRANQKEQRPCVLFAYPLGKSQHILASVDPAIGPILTHGSVERINAAYRASEVVLPETRLVVQASKAEIKRALVLAPLSARGSPWMRRLGVHSSAFASGWMRIRGMRRRRAIDRGFVLSDHADWPDLLRTIEETGARRVLVTHGYTAPLARWLAERGLDASVLQTRFSTEPEEAGWE